MICIPEPSMKILPRILPNLIRFKKTGFIKHQQSVRTNKTRHPGYGFTMIETIVGLATMLIFFAAVAAIFQNILTNIGTSRVRTVALALAQEKMELIRNLPFSDIGTIGGIPQGMISPSETVTINNQQFTITTSIIYIDDPFDQIAPSDTINTDYKRVRIEITWGGVYPSRIPVSLITNFAPKGIETVAGGGTLFITVINSSGNPIQNATVTVNNDTVLPPIHMQTLTNANGIVVLPGTPACISCYRITVSKTAYSQDRTYSTGEVANPLMPDPTVIEGSITQVTFSIDELSSIIVNSYSQSLQPVSNVAFTLLGSKIIGYDSDDNPVLKFSRSINTGGGTVTISAIEWDTYTLDFTDSSYTLAGSNPPIPFVLPPKTNQTLPIVVYPKANASLLLYVKNSTGILMASASATLTNIPNGYASTVITPSTGSANFGQAYFPSLLPAIYDLKVNLAGYAESTTSVTISTNQQETVQLNTL